MAKARLALDKARRVFAIGLYDEAGRHAYYAAFHAAQALLFERTDKVYATHQGVKAEFARLAKSDTRIERKHTTFLARAYSLKSAADYETGAAANVTATQASEAIALARSSRNAAELLPYPSIAYDERRKSLLSTPLYDTSEPKH